MPMSMLQYSSNLARVVTDEDRGSANIAADGAVGVIITAAGAAIAWRPPASLTPDHVEATTAARAHRIATKAAGRIAAIEGDERLSDAAKAEDSAKVAAEALAEFAPVKADAERARAAFIAADARELAPPALAPTDVVGGLLDRELRDYVRGLTAEGHNALAQSLVDGKNPRMLDALQRSPIPLPDVLAAVLPGAREAVMLKDNPAFAKQAREAREHSAWLRDVLVQAENALPRVAGSRNQQFDAARDADIARRNAG